jgi:hypothetical protein
VMWSDCRGLFSAFYAENRPLFAADAPDGQNSYVDFLRT